MVGEFFFHSIMFLSYTDYPYLNIAVNFTSTEYVSTVCSNKASPIGTVFCLLFITFLLDSSLSFYICYRKQASPCFKTVKKNNGK